MSVNFLNQRRLNSGGNGDLYLAQRSDNGEWVVIKYLRECQDAHARKSFAREARVLGRRLRGLVSLICADLNAPQPYYVMPFLSGGSLARHSGRLTVDQLHAVALDLAHTLRNLHSAFEAHGDFKPDNVLVTQDGHLQVADPLGNGTVFTILFSQNRGGTPGYWAPEIRNGGSISYAGDVYSYGATLHHLVTGQRPQDGVPLDVNSWSYASIPKIREIVAACCLADPQARPNMSEVLQMLAGKGWANIQAERRQRKEALKGVCVGACLIGGLLLIGAASER